MKPLIVLLFALAATASLALAVVDNDILFEEEKILDHLLEVPIDDLKEALDKHRAMHNLALVPSSDLELFYELGHLVEDDQTDIECTPEALSAIDDHLERFKHFQDEYIQTMANKILDGLQESDILYCIGQYSGVIDYVLQHRAFLYTMNAYADKVVKHLRNAFGEQTVATIASQTVGSSIDSVLDARKNINLALDINDIQNTACSNLNSESLGVIFADALETVFESINSLLEKKWSNLGNTSTAIVSLAEGIDDLHMSPIKYYLLKYVCINNPGKGSRLSA